MEKAQMEKALEHKEVDHVQSNQILGLEGTRDLPFTYIDMYSACAPEDKLRDYLEDKFSSARNLINNIARRKKTVLDVACAIAEEQRDFFEGGQLKALTMKDISSKLGIHESTVSRAVSGKYMQFGNHVYELRFFFTQKLPATGHEEISAAEVRTVIKEIIEKESRKRPLSDQKIADRLSLEGITISRRTVAKYREKMDIPAASKRKDYR